MATLQDNNVKGIATPKIESVSHLTSINLDVTGHFEKNKFANKVPLPKNVQVCIFWALTRSLHPMTSATPGQMKLQSEVHHIKQFYTYAFIFIFSETLNILYVYFKTSSICIFVIARFRWNLNYICLRGPRIVLAVSSLGKSVLGGILRAELGYRTKLKLCRENEIILWLSVI